MNLLHEIPMPLISYLIFLAHGTFTLYNQLTLDAYVIIVACAKAVIEFRDILGLLPTLFRRETLGGESAPVVCDLMRV